MAALRGVKLLLDETQGTKYVPSLTSKALLGKYQKDAVQVTGDYLKRLVDHLKLVIARRVGVFSGMNLSFVLSVPAIWSDKVKDATLRAAFRAGIPAADVSLVSEPEAAALYPFRSTQPNSIAVCHSPLRHLHMNVNPCRKETSSLYVMLGEARW